MIEIKVPDIGNFDSVDVIEVLVKAGDTIAKEDSLDYRRIRQSVDGHSFATSGRSERSESKSRR